ncbi:hypothetical protein D3C71_1937790 [compost metagenome]
MREEQPAERASEKADGIGAESCDHAGCRRIGREKKLAENKRRRRSINDEVIVFEHGSDEAGNGGSLDMRRICRRCVIDLNRSIGKLCHDV